MEIINEKVLYIIKVYFDYFTCGAGTVKQILLDPDSYSAVAISTKTI